MKTSTTYFWSFLALALGLSACQKEETYPGSIYGWLKMEPGYERTLEAIDRSGLAERYQDPHANLTFFAMPNPAWSAYFQNVSYAYSNVGSMPPSLLAEIINYHTLYQQPDSSLAEGYVESYKPSGLFSDRMCVAYHRAGLFNNTPTQLKREQGSWQVRSIGSIWSGLLAPQTLFLDPEVELARDAISNDIGLAIFLGLEVLRDSALVILPTNKAIQLFLDERNQSAFSESDLNDLYYSCFTQASPLLLADLQPGQQLQVAGGFFTVVQDTHGNIGLQDRVGRVGKLVRTDIVSDNGVTHYIDRVIGVD